MAERSIGELRTRRLTRTYAEDNGERLVEIANVIPHTSWSADMITAEEVIVDSANIPFLGKWEHSFVLEDDGYPIAMAIGYEAAERFGVKQAHYLGTLACDRAYKGNGLGEQLLGTYLSNALEKGYLVLPRNENTTFMLQTGADARNAPVRKLYEKYGYAVDHEIPRDGGRRWNAVMIAKMGDVAHVLAAMNG